MPLRVEPGSGLIGDEGDEDDEVDEPSAEASELVLARTFFDEVRLINPLTDATCDL